MYAKAAIYRNFWLVFRPELVPYKRLFVVLAGINMDGRKEILGMWMSENESASFWANICNELKNRGVSDILIACRDNLSGFSQAIEAAIIYTTNAVEGFHRMLRKYTKTKTIYPANDAVRKSVYLSIQETSRKWRMPIRDWGAIIGQLGIFFEGRILV